MNKHSKNITQPLKSAKNVKTCQIMPKHVNKCRTNQEKHNVTLILLWFCFDTALVFFMVLETWIMSVVVLLSSTNSSSGMGTIIASIVEAMEHLAISILWPHRDL